MRLRDDIAKTIYASDASIRRGDASFGDLGPRLQQQYQHNAELVITEHILPLLVTIANIVEELGGDRKATVPTAVRALDALLAEYEGRL